MNTMHVQGKTRYDEWKVNYKHLLVRCTIRTNILYSKQLKLWIDRPQAEHMLFHLELRNEFIVTQWWRKNLWELCLEVYAFKVYNTDNSFRKVIHVTTNSRYTYKITPILSANFRGILTKLLLSQMLISPGNKTWFYSFAITENSNVMASFEK